MTQFDDREKAYEKEFARNEEFDFNNTEGLINEFDNTIG